MDMLERKGVRLVVYLPMELDHHYTEEIRREVDQVIREEPICELEFDFSRTIFMDSAGIGMLLGRYKIMKALDRLSKVNVISFFILLPPPALTEYNLKSRTV